VYNIILNYVIVNRYVSAVPLGASELVTVNKQTNKAQSQLIRAKL